DAHRVLHLFASPPEAGAPDPADPGVRYFGPGIHRPGRITLESGQTAYLAAGAVVYGSIHARGASHLRVAGRGILDVSPYERGEGGGAIRLSDCADVTIEGVTLRDPDVWALSLFGCRGVEIADVKLIGLWRYNADGIDICNSQDVRVRDCFVRSYDDSIALKGLKGTSVSFDDRPVRGVRVSGCTIWNDWGRALEIGAETCAPEIADVVFEDCDIVRTTHIALDIQHGDRAAVHDIRFRDIRVEMDGPQPRPRLQTSPEDRYEAAPEESYLPRLAVVEIVSTHYSKDTERGTVRDVRFEGISVTAPRMPESVLRGWDGEHSVEGVAFADLSRNGEAVKDAASARLTAGPHVGPIQLDRPPANGAAGS
ncbi:MAG: glycosyl hydrolase family 28 protein, partial [Gemmatimonadota bacterium]